MNSPLPKAAYQKNAHIYKILANEKRLEILNILKTHKQASVEDLISVTGMSKTNLSQHLALLRLNGLVVPIKKGIKVTYKIVDPRIVEPCKILHQLRGKELVV